MNITLGQYIKQQRELLGLSTAELSKKAGVSVGYINRIEHDKTKNHNVLKLQKLANALGLDEKYILASVGYNTGKNIERDWLIEVQDILTTAGFNKVSVLEITSYIETVLIKQEFKSSKFDNLLNRVKNKSCNITSDDIYKFYDVRDK